MRKLCKLILAATIVLSALSIAPKSVKADGWVTKADGYYYVYDNGTVAKNTTIGFFIVGPTGRLTFQEAIDQTNNFLALVQAQQAQAANPAPAVATPAAVAPAGSDLATICANIAGPVASSGASDLEKIRTLYNYMINSTEYLRDYTTPTGNWGPAYAQQCLTTGRGNCYRYAAAFAYLLKAAGYDTRIAYGQIHAARGGLTPHSWTEICLNGVWYTCDCEMADAKKGKYDFFIKTVNEYPVKPLVAQGYLPVAF